MKAIIVAAGLGSRMKRLTAKRPKSSLEIGGISIFEHQLAALRSIGISDISVVVGHAASFFDDFADVKKYVNENYKENNILSSLMCASAELDSDVVVCYSDILFRADALQDLLPMEHDFVAVSDVDWQQNYVGRTDHPQSQAENVKISEGKILAIGKHLGTAESDAEFIGVFAMSSAGCAIFKSTFTDVQQKFSGRPFQQSESFERAYLADMIQELIDRGFEVGTRMIRGGWKEIDTEQDYLSAIATYKL